MLGEVALEGMEFYARHGYYEEERKIGNKYTVDVFIILEMEEAVSEDKLEGTVNYEKVYEIVGEVMGVNASLLEHLAGKLVKKIKQEFSAIESVRVRVSKHNPPIKGLCRKATVSLQG